jgi:hypothetical protein
MTQSSNIYFEIFDGGDIIRIEPLNAVSENSNVDRDINSITSKITVKGGGFSGEFVADIMTSDFELLKRDLRNLVKNFNGRARFEPLERQLLMDIKGDGLGHFEVNCVAHDHPVHGGTLTFSLNFDQTEINRLINELEIITKQFPIKGDSIINNE